MGNRTVTGKYKPDHARKRAERKGRMAEHLCALRLRLKGYSILEKRYRGRPGEIDLIAKRGNVLAFVEVKARDTAAGALESVTPKNRQRVTNAATAFIIGNPGLAGHFLRFDVMYVTPLFATFFAWPRHIKGAWECDGQLGSL